MPRMLQVLEDRTMRFRCSCGRTLRVSARHAGRAGRCPACRKALRIPADAGGEADPLTRALRARPLPGGEVGEGGEPAGWLGGGLAFPLRGVGPLLILSAPVLWFLRYVPWIGGVVYAMVVATIFLDNVRAAADGPRGRPAWPEILPDWPSCLWQTARFAVLVILLALPATLLVRAAAATPGGSGYAVGAAFSLGLLVIYAPMALLLFAIYDSVRGALRLGLAVQALRRAPAAYGATALAVLGLGCTPGVASLLLAGSFGWGEGPALAPLTMLTTLAMAGVLGAFYHRHRQHLGL